MWDDHSDFRRSSSWFRLLRDYSGQSIGGREEEIGEGGRRGGGKGWGREGQRGKKGEREGGGWEGGRGKGGGREGEKMEGRECEGRRGGTNLFNNRCTIPIQKTNMISS